MSAIKFDIDDEKKTVTPQLPEIVIDSPNIDASSLKYLPSTSDIKLQDVIELSKRDALKEVAEQGQVYTTAGANARKLVEALLLPVLASENYTVLWKD